MGQRARIKAVKREVKGAWSRATEEQKAALAKALDHGPLTRAEILKRLRAEGDPT